MNRFTISLYSIIAILLITTSCTVHTHPGVAVHPAVTKTTVVTTPRKNVVVVHKKRRKPACKPRRVRVY